MARAEDELESLVDDSIKYAFSKDAEHEGLIGRIDKMKAAIQNISKVLEEKIESLDPDQREKVESNIRLLEREIEKSQEESKYYQAILDNDSFDVVDETISADEEGKDAISVPTIPKVPIGSNTPSIRQRTRATDEWQVSENPQDQTKSMSRRKEHDELSAELVHMARRLKLNNLAIQELVSKDKSTLNEADLALNTNASRFREQHKELKAYSNKTWASTWRLLIMTIFVLISMLMAFLLILVSKSR